jgi:lipoprotein signal peptidase
LSGALGNVIDRAGLGYVIDFLLFDIPGHQVVLFNRLSIIPWPVFNLADAFVLGGVVMLLGKELLGRGLGTRRRGLGLEPRTPAADARALAETAAAPAEGK